MLRLKKYLFEKRFHFSRFQFNLVSLAFIILGIVVSSYLALFKISNVFALNDTTKTWTFNLANTGLFTKDATLVTVDDSGARPVTGVNKIINPAFSSDTSSWSLAAVSGATTPAGWVVVPGNSTYSTTDFLSMKYEAKCAATSDLTTGLTAPDSGYHTYSDSGTTCTSGNSKAVVSVASGYPIANISQTNSIARCSAITVGGGTAHLITNNEWMTVARNAEAQAGNWSLGSVGSGYLYAGHNDNVPALALAASTTDTGNNACAYTDTAGTTEAPASCPTNTANNTSGTTGNQKRVLTLSNGQYIWDIPGNVWEWTNDTIQGKDQPTSGTPGFAWREFTALTTYGTLTYDKVRPLASSYDATYGIGRIYSDGTVSNTTSYGFLRGGSWSNTSSSGAFALNLVSTPGYTVSPIGFRCASDPVAISQSYSSSSGRAGGGNTITIGQYTDAKLTESVNVGNTSTYDFSTYVYDSTAGNVGGTVSSSIAQLYYNGAVISTTYASAGSGWWKLSGTLTGANAAREFGLLIKTGKTIKADDFTLAKSGTYSVYTTTAYTNAQVSSWDSFTASVTGSGNATVGYQICLNDGSACSYSTGSRWQYYTGGAWANAADATQTNTAAQLTQAAMQALSVTSQKISVMAVMGFGGTDLPAISSIAIGLTTDTTPPNNTTAITMKKNVSALSGMTANGWTNDSSPYFTWPVATDLPSPGGSGLKGYCLFITSGNTNPSLQTSVSDYLPDNTGSTLDSVHISSADTQCGNGAGFLVSTNSIDFATTKYRGTAISRSWLSSSNTAYYLYVKSVDNAGNIASDPNVFFYFRFDNTNPINPSYLSVPGDWIATKSASLLWSASGADGPTDTNSGISGLQYRIGSSGTWYGDSHSGAGDNTDLLANDGTYSTQQNPDFANLAQGSNIVYLHTWDNAGNVSTSYISGALKINTTSPSAPRNLAVSTSDSTTNSYSFTWDDPSAFIGQASNLKFCYTVNTVPTSTTCTFTSSGANSLPADAFATQPGTNTLYLVAKDEAGNINYESYTSVTFTYSGSAPGIPRNVDVSDISIKATSNWKLAVSWDAPSSVGAGVTSYKVYRSTTNTTCSANPSSFTQIGTTAGTSYSDVGLSQVAYYYCVKACDSASNCSAVSSTIPKTPNGKYFTAAGLTSGPTAGSITTKKATITWSTDRGSDSRVAFGTSSGSYGSDEVSNSSQITSHSVNLTNLKAGTTYYYKAKWTDEDGNMGTADEKTFSTDAAPTVKDVAAKNIGLSSAIIQFTSKGSSKVKIYYGTTTGFGGAKEISTSTTETTYTSELTGLADGTKYYYKLNTFDSESGEYEGTILDFTTLPRPKISSVRIKEVKGTAQPTILVSWITNTEVSSIITYYPNGKVSDARDEVNITLTAGEHRMVLRGLYAQTDYILVVKGRDRIGTEAASDTQRVTTSTDTRPPQVINVKIEGGVIPAVGSPGQESSAQLVVSWDTDEPGTSQIEFGEGTGDVYSQKTQEDSNFTMNHLVVISNLTPSKVYHLRTISKDKAANEGKSIDSVTITPKSTQSALDLVVGNLSEVFGFLGTINK